MDKALELLLAPVDKIAEVRVVEDQTCGVRPDDWRQPNVAAT